jgi:hypothetical protein
MVARGAGAVGCAHCKLIGADRSCQVCTRLVCERCAANWATCEAPSGRILRLGSSARLRDVDPMGRLGFVTHWRKAPRLFDLRRMRWVHGVDITRRAYLWNRKYPPRLTGDGRIIYGAWTIYAGDDDMFEGMHVEDLQRKRAHVIRCESPVHGTAVSPTGDSFYYVTTTQRVALIVPGATTEIVLDPLPRRVIQAVHLDAERNLLASASWNELVLHRIDDAKLTLLSQRKTDAVGDVPWLAIGGPWLATAVVGTHFETGFTGRMRIEVHRLDRDTSIGDVVYTKSCWGPGAAALSRDGRYLAFANTEGLVVRDLANGTSDLFTDQISELRLVRFAGNDHMLITANYDRVIMRPRTPTGYRCPLIAIDVPRETVDLPPVERPIAIA